MRKRVFCWILAAVFMLGLCACGAEETGPRDIVEETELGEIAEEKTAEGTLPWGNSGQQEENGAAAADVSQKARPVSYGVSDVEASLRCEGEAFYKLNFAAGGQQVYVCGTGKEPPVGGSLGDDTYFVGVTEAPSDAWESCRIRALSIDFPENMRVLRMAADSAGNCHLLWVSKAEKTVDGQTMEAFTYEQSCIMEINAEGAVLKRIDTPELFEGEHGLMYCFTVDAEGNYYVERGSVIVKLAADGNRCISIDCDGSVEGIGCGRSGAMYCVRRGADREGWLCRIEEDGVTPLGALPRADARYPCMGSGTDTELILFHKDGGIYAVDAGGRDQVGDAATDAEVTAGNEAGSNGSAAVTAELRVQEAEMPVSGQDIAGQGILGDGRVCLYHWSKGESIFYYIPVGK